MQTGTNYSESFQTIYEDERSFLEKTVIDYPASPFSLFLLLQEYKRTADPGYDDLAKKALIYFQNPAWINYQLSGDELMKDIQEKPASGEEEVIIFPETEDQPLSVNTEENFEREREIQNAPTYPSEKEVEQEAIHEMEQEEKVEFVQGEELEGFEKSFIENEEEEKEESESPAANEKTLEKEDKIGESELAEIAKKEAPRMEEIIADPDIASDSEKEAAIVSEDSGSEEYLTGKEENLPESSVSLSETNDQKEEEIQNLEFEPLHTIDYFASQGIIIREEALMNDKLGKQVKSFTDWLKSMKRLHPGKLPEQNEVVEKIIQSSAELSNEDAGILTESMAEVLLKQGKKGKAIEMFEKLSLMNPSKSIYFAAKIESLKNK